MVYVILNSVYIYVYIFKYAIGKEDVSYGVCAAQFCIYIYIFKYVIAEEDVWDGICAPQF